jgi:hypothetical protein
LANRAFTDSYHAGQEEGCIMMLTYAVALNIGGGNIIDM